MRKVFLLAGLFSLVMPAAHAQLGGVIKKTKEKTENKETATETKPAESNPATSPGNDDRRTKPKPREQKTEVQTMTADGFYITNGTDRPIHQKYMNKIVFAPTREAIAFEKENEAAFTDKFVFGEPNNCRVYLDNSLSNYILQLVPGADKKIVNAWATFRVHFFFNGTEIYAAEMAGASLQPEERQKFTTFRGMIEDRKKDRSQNIFAGAYQVFLSSLDQKLSPGNHKVRLEVRPFCYKLNEIEGKTVATGEFTLIVKPNSIDPNDEDFCISKAGFKDAKVEAAILKDYVKHGGNKQTKQVRLTSETWQIIRHEYTGVILRREANATVVSINEKGYCVYETFIVTQEYVGGKFEDEITLSQLGGEGRINIQCIK